MKDRMAHAGGAPVLFLTNSVYGESTYEETLWKGVSRGALAEGAPLCTVIGGQLLRGPAGEVKVPFLFQIAGRFQTQGTVVNAGTLQQGITHEELEEFVERFPGHPKVATAIALKSVPSVTVDNFSGMKSMIEFLVHGLSRNRIAYVSGPLTNSEAADRLKAYREVLTKAGIPLDPDLIYEGTWNSPSGTEAIRHFLDKSLSFDAVACANDLMALAVMEELQHRGVAVPEQVAVTGFDDIDAARYAIPQLSTVFQPIADLGTKAVEALFRSAAESTASRIQTIPARVVHRASAPQAAGSTPAGGTADPTRLSGDERWTAVLRDLRRAPETNGLSGDILDWILETWSQNRIPAPAAVSSFLRKSRPGEQEQFVTLLATLRAGLALTLETTDQWRRATTILQVLTETHRDHQFHEDFLVAKKHEAVMAALIGVNRILNQVGSLASLEEAVAAGFSQCGIDTCHVVFVEGANSSQGRMIASVIGGIPQKTFETSRSFDLAQVIEGGLARSPDSQWLLFPLTFEDQDFGYLAFLRTKISPFLYESLSNMVSAVLHSLLLIQRIEKAETLTAQRADKISDLVRPMIDALKSTGASAREQGGVMAALVQTNSETGKRLSGLDKHVARMKEALEQVVDLIGAIEEVSETINVIAINAAIAAARAGADGKVFGVISAEIRKLSIQTKANTGQITGVLNELGAHAQTFFEANDETRRVFSRLESEIRRLVDSLEGIQRAMESMDGQAQLVLHTMAGES